ncbi:MAG: hypothetical protein ACREPJ_08410 [Rhodanobacteraceae bacterium]
MRHKSAKSFFAVHPWPATIPPVDTSVPRRPDAAMHPCMLRAKRGGVGP